MTPVPHNEVQSNHPQPAFSNTLISLALYFYTAIFLVGIGLIFLFQRQESSLPQIFGFNPPLSVLGYGFLAGISVLLLTTLSRQVSWIKNLEHEFRTVLGPLNFYHCVILALLSSVAEEVFFRGGLQPLIGLVPASLLFGLAHFPLKRTLAPWTIFAFIMGLLLGGLYQLTNSLVTPIITHGLINLVNLYRLSYNKIN